MNERNDSTDDYSVSCVNLKTELHLIYFTRHRKNLLHSTKVGMVFRFTRCDLDERDKLLRKWYRVIQRFLD